MTRETNARGFGVIGILLAIVVIGIFVAGGWIVYHNDHKTNNVINKTTNNTAKSSKSNSSSQSATNPTQTYMDISQWGVKIPLFSEIPDLYYVVGTGTQDSSGQSNTIWLGLKSITSTSCTPTNSNANNTELASILRTPPGDTDPVSGKPISTKYPYGTTIDGYYYALGDERTLVSGCASQNTLNSIDAALRSAAQKIVND